MGKIIETQSSAPLLVAPGLEMETDPAMLTDNNHHSTKTTMPQPQQQSKMTTRRRRRSRRVHFGEDQDSDASVTVHSYDKDCSPEAIQQSWYSQEEYSLIRATNHAMLREHRRRIVNSCSGFSCNSRYSDGSSSSDSSDDEESPLPEDDWTPRGFEYVLQRYPRKQLRITHSDNVLHFQKVLDYDCPTALADYTSNSSYACGSEGRARLLALGDQQEASEIYRESPSLSPSSVSSSEDDDNSVVVEPEDCPKIRCSHNATPVLTTSSSGKQPVVWRAVRKFFFNCL